MITFTSPKTSLVDGEMRFYEAVIAELDEDKKPRTSWGALIAAAAIALYFGRKTVKILSR